MKKISWLLANCFLLAWLVCAQLCAQQGNPSIIIKPRPTEETMLALPDFQKKGESADPALSQYLKTINETLWNDLEYSTFFKMLAKSYYPVRRVAEPQDLVFKEWQDIGMKLDFIVIGNARVESNFLVVQCRVYDLKTKEQVLGKQFKTLPNNTRAIAHRIADIIVSTLSANASKGVASTQITFEKKTPTGKEIYVMDYDGDGVQQLTANGSINLTPVWHPNGEMICFTSYKAGTPSLYFITLPKGEVTPFPVKGGILTTPAFSPDGQELAFSGRLENSVDTDIYISSLDGTRLRNITQNPGIDVSPCWNPTGKQLAFISSRTGIPQLFLCDAFGANVDRIVTEGGYASSPDWSPDGRYIVFSWKPSHFSNFDIFVVEVASRKILQLTQGALNNENPSWAPDGRHIVFQSDRSGSAEIYSMFSDGTEIRRLTKLGGCSNPGWSGYINKN